MRKIHVNLPVDDEEKVTIRQELSLLELQRQYNDLVKTIHRKVVDLAALATVIKQKDESQISTEMQAILSDLSMVQCDTQAQTLSFRRWESLNKFDRIVRCVQCQRYHFYEYYDETEEYFGETIPGHYCPDCIQQWRSAQYDRYIQETVPCNICKTICTRSQFLGNKLILKGMLGSRYDYYDYCESCAHTIKASHERQCDMCDIPYIAPNRTELINLCLDCRPKWGIESRRVASHNSRTSLLNLPSTLTLKQWVSTLDYFQQKCAYCRKKDYSDLEHYHPISQGGGTTIDNCLPSCGRCNNRKSDRMPDQLSSLFPAENLERIAVYLESVKVACSSG